MKRVAKNVVNFLLGMLTVTFVVILVGNLWMMYQSTVQHSKSKALVTHRINRVVTHDKDHVYETKGDANNTIDKGVINLSQIIGVYQLHLKGFGSKLMFL